MAAVTALLPSAFWLAIGSAALFSCEVRNIVLPSDELAVRPRDHD
jgi:hypothetical protein